MPIHNWTRVYPGLFHDFHQTWTIYIKNSLNGGLLPTGLQALVEQRTGPKEADVLTVNTFSESRRARETDGAILTMEAPHAQIVRRSSKKAYATRANRIVVKQNLGRTVAVIEIVSPGNKSSKRDFKDFVDESVQYIATGVHLLVVDLFPPTRRDPFGIHRAIWDEFEEEDVLFEFPPGKDRIIASYDAGREKAAYVEPVAVGDVLPAAALFLMEGRHIKVPLEATYQATWDVLPARFQEMVETGAMPEDEDEA